LYNTKHFLVKPSNETMVVSDQNFHWRDISIILIIVYINCSIIEH